MRWWPFHPDPHGIITQYKEPLSIGSPCQVNPKPFFIINSNSAHPSHNSPGMFLRSSLTLASHPGARTPFSPFVNCLCHSTNNTLSNILNYCLRQTPSHKPHQTPNQLSTLHAPWLIQPIITYHASPANWSKPRCVKTTNQIHPIMVIKKSMKKRYIRLTKTW